MQFYAKLIAAVVGLAVIIASRFGLNLEEQQQLITDALVAVITAVLVYAVPNKPTTPEQVRVVERKVVDAKSDIAVKQMEERS